jgi:hypothetical protein
MIMIVPEVGCGSQDVGLRTTSELRGIVLDPKGQPAPRIPVELEVLSSAAEKYSTTIGEESDAKGAFALVGVPDADVRLSYGTDHPSSEGCRYPVVYYPDSESPSHAAALRLRMGEKRTGLVLRLPPPPRVAHLAIRVLKPNGSGVGEAFVDALLSGLITESAKTGPDGRAELTCLVGLRYQLTAHIFAGLTPSAPVIRNRPAAMVCGKDSGPFTLTLDHQERF